MQKINFQDLPNTTTPINATNLNAMQTNAETAINETKPSAAINNVNLNDYTDFGFKYFGTGCTNAPSTYIYVQTITNGGDATQIAYSVLNHEMWKRGGALYDGVRQWTDWEKIVNKHKILYEGSIKSYGNYTLNDYVDNYDYIEVFANRGIDFGGNSVKIRRVQESGKILLYYVNNAGDEVYMHLMKFSWSGTTFTYISNTEIQMVNGQNIIVKPATSVTLNYDTIQKIVGWKY